MKEYEINQELDNQRLDKVIVILEPSISRTAVQRMLEEGYILVNGKKQKPSYHTCIRDKVTIQKEEIKPIELKAQEIPISIVYEDEDMLIVNKPKGMVVHPANGNPDGTLVNAVMAICKDSLSGIGGELRPGIVHRLDKDTSGLVMIAKNDKTHRNLSEQIKNRKVHKTYLAFVRGNVKEEQATIHMPIGRSKKDRKKMAVDRQGKEAITHFKVLRRYGNYTLLEVKIETGRTHQIRVHLSYIGYPIVGDSVYSNGKNPYGVEGQMLHAQRLEFMHPTSQKKMCVEAPVPPYFTEVIEKVALLQERE